MLNDSNINFSNYSIFRINSSMFWLVRRICGQMSLSQKGLPRYSYRAASIYTDTFGSRSYPLFKTALGALNQIAGSIAEGPSAFILLFPPYHFP